MGVPWRILIRVDGSETIGMGHVMRCLTLARKLAALAGVEPAFLMRDFPAGVRRAASEGYAVETVPATATPAEEVACLRRWLQHRRVDGLITDLRGLTPGLVEEAKAHGVLCATIDEWGSRAITSDLLINGTIVPAWHAYTLEGEVQCCFGPRYALLDDAFVQETPAPRMASAGRRTVLIALGGDDPFCLTSKAMRALELVTEPLAITAVIGPAFLDAQEIRARAARSAHRYEVHENTPAMAQLMRRAEVTIGGGGLVALEMACAGTAGVILCEVPHQLETAAVLEQQGAAVSLGFGVAVSEMEIAGTVQALLADHERRQAMSSAGPRLVDGRGVERVADALLHVLTAKHAGHGSIVPAGR